jgi:amino acid transporter
MIYLSIITLSSLTLLAFVIVILVAFVIDNVYFYKSPKIDHNTGIMYCPNCGTIIGNIYDKGYKDENCHRCHLGINYGNINKYNR